MSSYVKDWGDYFFEMNKLPPLWETVVDKAETGSNLQGSIRGKIEEVSDEIASALEEWNDEAQVLLLNMMSLHFSYSSSYYYHHFFRQSIAARENDHTQKLNEWIKCCQGLTKDSNQQRVALKNQQRLIYLLML